MLKKFLTAPGLPSPELHVKIRVQQTDLLSQKTPKDQCPRQWMLQIHSLHWLSQETTPEWAPGTPLISTPIALSEHCSTSCSQMIRYTDCSCISVCQVALGRQIASRICET